MKAKAPITKMAKKKTAVAAKKKSAKQIAEAIVKASTTNKKKVVPPTKIKGDKTPKLFGQSEVKVNLKAEKEGNKSILTIDTEKDQFILARLNKTGDLEIQVNLESKLLAVAIAAQITSSTSIFK